MSKNYSYSPKKQFPHFTSQHRESFHIGTGNLGDLHTTSKRRTSINTMDCLFLRTITSRLDGWRLAKRQAATAFIDFRRCVRK